VVAIASGANPWPSTSIPLAAQVGEPGVVDVVQPDLATDEAEHRHKVDTADAGTNDRDHRSSAAVSQSRLRDVKNPMKTTWGGGGGFAFTNSGGGTESAVGEVSNAGAAIVMSRRSPGSIE
jgi:hypothetical protein